MQSARSAASTCTAPVSASEWTATLRNPSLRQVAMIRQAISPRLAIRTLRMGRGAVRNSVIQSHPVNGPRRAHDGLHRPHRKTKTQNAPRVPRVDDAIVEQPRGAEIGVRLFLEHTAQLVLMGRQFRLCSRVA